VNTDFIRMAHVLDHSNHHQVYTNFKFIGKCNYIKLPTQYLWDNTSLQNNSFLLFLALQFLADGKPLPQLLSVFSVLRHRWFGAGITFLL